MKSDLWVDPIVEEVRAARQEMLGEVDFDLRALCKRLMKNQKRHGRNVVHPPSVKGETTQFSKEEPAAGIDEILERSRERLRKEGGIPIEEVRKRFGLG
ncbi:MAG: hypothetical protein HUU16_09710 [Candidatus Omnitrophica bacterium]|nr:hypothetical protein [bacterium]NUN96438.1 hypothetical protein [Candidatus Omnitrophota bacterium]